MHFLSALHLLSQQSATIPRMGLLKQQYLLPPTGTASLFFNPICTIPSNELGKPEKYFPLK